VNLYITTTAAHEIVDICSNPVNRSQVGKDALAAGGQTYFVELADAWIGDHYDGAAHVKDSPLRAAAQACAQENSRLRSLIESLTAVKDALEADVGSLTIEQISQWRGGISAVDAWAKWQPYEKRSALLLIALSLYILRHLGAE